jgi:hypothetical protein
VRPTARRFSSTTFTPDRRNGSLVEQTAPPNIAAITCHAGSVAAQPPLTRARISTAGLQASGGAPYLMGGQCSRAQKLAWCALDLRARAASRGRRGRGAPQGAPKAEGARDRYSARDRYGEC